MLLSLERKELEKYLEEMVCMEITTNRMYHIVALDYLQLLFLTLLLLPPLAMYILPATTDT